LDERVLSDLCASFQQAIIDVLVAKTIAAAQKCHVDLVTDQILRAAKRENFEGTAYCFMPDHVHLVATGSRDDSDLKAFVARAKQFSGFEFSKRNGTRLWQRYGYERVLRNEESTDDLIRYIIANPIRAGLVSNVKDYPFWGSFVYSRDELLDFIHWAG